MLFNEDGCNQKSGDDEEDVNADETPGYPGRECVECNNRQDRDSSQSINFGAISQRIACRAGIGVELCRDYLPAMM